MTSRTASLSPDVNNPGFRNVTFDELATAYADILRAPSVTIQVGDQEHQGRGVATDIVEASIRAYIVALNRATIAAHAPARQRAAEAATVGT